MRNSLSLSLQGKGSLRDGRISRVAFTSVAQNTWRRCIAVTAGLFPSIRGLDAQREGAGGTARFLRLGLPNYWTEPGRAFYRFL